MEHQPKVKLHTQSKAIYQQKIAILFISKPCAQSLCCSGSSHVQSIYGNCAPTKRARKKDATSEKEKFRQKNKAKRPKH